VEGTLKSMASTVDLLCEDLAAERADLDVILAAVKSSIAEIATPSVGWTILDQVTHLAWFDDAARMSIVDPQRFRSECAKEIADIGTFVERVSTAHRHMEDPVARQWMEEAGSNLITAARAAEPDTRVPWYGPDMTIASCITARIMETWAHGQDIADAVGVQRTPTARLRHVAYIGARTFANSFHANGLPVPNVVMRVLLTAPNGDVWVFGPDDTIAVTDTVTGSALDFCLLVTQRRHRADTALVATGAAADQWLDIAQAFAGPPGSGRAPGAQRQASPERENTEP